jgi:hypothetical protein
MKENFPNFQTIRPNFIWNPHFSYIKSNKMQQCNKILFLIYMELNMFRATHRPSSGA